MLISAHLDFRFAAPDDLEFIELIDKEEFLESKGVYKKDKRMSCGYRHCLVPLFLLT